MLRQVDWPKHRVYESRREHPPLEFYLKAFQASKKVDLLLGYFSFSAIRVLSLGFASFIARGGTMRIVANHLISENDYRILNTVNIDPDVVNLIDQEDFLQKLDAKSAHFFNCISFLITAKRIEFKFITPKGSSGISHYKDAIFYDDEDTVYASGSCNFTASGILSNLEKINVFPSWDSAEANLERTKYQKDVFEEYFKEENDEVDYIKEEKLTPIIQNEFNNPDIDELLATEKEILDLERKAIERNPRLKDTINQCIKKLTQQQNAPRFPYASGPRDYQKEALRNWLTNNQKGIFAMATGTGKTITSLNCLLRLFHSTSHYRAIILVPTVALVNQWSEECAKFHFKNIIKACSTAKWEREVSNFLYQTEELNKSAILISTYATFVTKKFQEYIHQLPDDMMLIADEAHNLGSAECKRTLQSIPFQKRIGLSATIERQFDQGGNEAISNFFDSHTPHTYEFSMETAITEGYLCKYNYFAIPVELTEPELEEYTSISMQLLKFFDASTGGYKKSKVVEMLLIQRARIIQKATNKKQAFNALVRDIHKSKGGINHCLVYVPEGTEPDYLKDDNPQGDSDTESLIDEYTKIVSQVHEDVLIRKFTSDTHKRDEILRNFSNGEINVLTSMKCLDEGIDVPRAEIAIFCASTGNPRQFIQRRGRVLRTHKEKELATIYDLIVIPPDSSNTELRTMQRNILKKELLRVQNFQSLANNKLDANKALHYALRKYNLSLYELSDS